MKIVHKYKVSMNDIPLGSGMFKIAMPVNAEIISVQPQKEDIGIWVLADTEFSVYDERLFCMYPTGYMFDESIYEHKYIGTILLLNGSFVGHIFELKKKEKQNEIWSADN